MIIIMLFAQCLCWAFSSLSELSSFPRLRLSSFLPRDSSNNQFENDLKTSWSEHSEGNNCGLSMADGHSHSNLFTARHGWVLKICFGKTNIKKVNPGVTCLAHFRHHFLWLLQTRNKDSQKTETGECLWWWGTITAPNRENGREKGRREEKEEEGEEGRGGQGKGQGEEKRLTDYYLG